MRRRLDQPLADSFRPAGVRVETLQPEDAAEAHRLLVLAYQDQDVCVAHYSAWLQAFEQDPEFDPALSFTAWDEHGMLGFIQCWTSAFIRDLVVHPRARYQGVGLGLLEHAFRVFQERGEGWVDLKVMDNNRPARCLYEKASMHYVRRTEMDHE